MSLPVNSQQQLYQLFLTVLLDEAPSLTDTLTGSDIDLLAGVFSLAAMELQRQTTIQFNKTFFDLAQGPDENGGGTDDLQALAIDHFGQNFARPAAAAAIDTVTFSRASGSVATYGAVTIPAGTIVKTRPDANGNVQRYSTNQSVTLTHASQSSDTSVSVGVTAVVAGAAGDAVAGAITVIESTLLDPTVNCTNAGNATGEDAQDSPTYRETIRNLITSLAGAVLAAIQAKALTVPGVVTATPVEQAITAIQYNPANGSTSGSYFRIPVPILYVADATGTASPTLIKAVSAVLQPVRACGVIISVQAASAATVNWTAHLTLNPSGPNYATFVNDPTEIVNAMTDYINNLPVGTSFTRATANAAMLALWGPSGTNDLTAFTTSIPIGDIFMSANQKPVAGTVGLA